MLMSCAYPKANITPPNGSHGHCAVALLTDCNEIRGTAGASADRVLLTLHAPLRLCAAIAQGAQLLVPV